MAGLHRATVKVSEYGLYALVLAQPATGLLATLSGGRPFALFVWQVPALMRHEVLRAWLHFHISLVHGRSPSWCSVMRPQRSFITSCCATMCSMAWRRP